VSEQALTAEVRSLRQHIAALAACLGARMTQQQVADHFGVHRNTITKWASERKDFPRRDVGGKYLRSEIMAWESNR
jgi:DNA-binding XRE family transcriptional regulator